MSMVEVDSMNVFGENVCDTCGDKATDAVRNKVEERSDSGFRKFVYGPWRFGCDIHEKKQITKFLDGTLEKAA